VPATPEAGPLAYTALMKTPRLPGPWRRTALLALALATALIQGAVVQGPASRAPLLSYFQHDEDGYRWMLWSARTRRNALFLASPGMPKNVLWMPMQASVYYILGRTVYRSRFDIVPARQERVAELPAADGSVRLLWVERGNRRLRIALMADQPQPQIRRPDLHRQARPRKRNGMPAATPIDTGWGLPFTASVYELADDRSGWKLLARRPTRDFAAGAPGVSVINDLRHESGVSNQRLLASYTCDDGGCGNSVPASLMRQAAQEIDITPGVDQLGSMAGAQQSTLLFRTVAGERRHMAGPVLLLKHSIRRGRQLVVLPTEGRAQLGLAVDRSLLLIADEMSGDRPLVAELDTGGVLLQVDGSGAVWVPRDDVGPDTQVLAAR
jgi:hypothetical protein